MYFTYRKGPKPSNFSPWVLTFHLLAITKQVKYVSNKGKYSDMRYMNTHRYPPSSNSIPSLYTFPPENLAVRPSVKHTKTAYAPYVPQCNDTYNIME